MNITALQKKVWEVENEQITKMPTNRRKYQIGKKIVLQENRQIEVSKPGTMKANHGDVVVEDNTKYNRDGALFRFSVLLALMR